MNDAERFALATTAAYAVTLIVGAFFRRRKSYAVAFACCALFACCPLLIPARSVILRAASAFLCLELCLKVVDFARQYSTTNVNSRFRDFVTFVVPFPVLAVVFGTIVRVPTGTSRWPALAPIAIGALGAAAGFSGRVFSGQLLILQECFLLDHLVAVVFFLFTIESLATAVYGLERLLGLAAPIPMRQVILSLTIAEFWWRFNVRVYQWFHLNVFKPSGGRRHPVRGVVLVFLASAVIHEWMFGVATSRLDGYQFAFFAAQIPAVLVSRKLTRAIRRQGVKMVAAARALTILWLVVTSVLFFHGLNRVFPFVYACEPWLP